MFRKLAPILRETVGVSEVAAAIGIGCLFYGSYQVYPPSAWIVVGLLALGFAYKSATARAVNRLRNAVQRKRAS